MLKMTKIEFEFIPDPGMYMLFEKGTRGGISDISNRYSKDNSKYLESFDPQEASKHIMNLDGNNLYGYPKTKLLPTNEFKWLDPKSST